LTTSTLDADARYVSAGLLRRIRTKSFRNGNWWRLSQAERALYKSAIGLAALRGYVANLKLVKLLRELAARLLETPSIKILRLGYARAEQMIQNFNKNGLEALTSILLNNLSNWDYIFCMGLVCLNMRDAGVALV